VADDSLQSWWYPDRPLLLIHCGCALSPSTGSCLGVQVLGLIILSWLLWLHHAHLLGVWRRSLCWIGRRSASLVRTIRVVVHARLLSQGVLCRVLVHLHVSIRRVLRRLSLLCCDDLLLCLLALPAHPLEALLFLDARCWGPARSGLQCHGWNEWTREFGLCDKGMKFRLCGRPSLQWVQVQQSLRKVNEGSAVGHFCSLLATNTG
jgi:hypothetical protein